MAHESVVISLVIAIFGLLLVAAVSAVGLKKARLPYSVGLVIIGLCLGALSHRVEGLAFLHEVTLTPEVIFFVFLPTLIFESAFSLDSHLLSKNIVPVIVLAAPGLLLSTAIIGGLICLLTPLSIGPALLFGALISATDPVAVVALFKELGAPHRLAILVEGESLFNDATAIVLFKIMLAVLAGGVFGIGTVGNGIVDFLVVFGGGLLVGGIIGWLMVRSIALSDNDPLVQVSLSTVVAYAAFIAADHYLHVSGVMATVGAGIVIGALGTPRFTPEVRAFLHQFWEYAAFAANGLIFLLVGMSIDLIGLAGHIMPIIIAIVVVMLVRSVITFTLIPALGRVPGSDPIDWRYRIVLWWGGLRGAVSLALAFSLPHDFPHHDLIISLAVGVVLFTLLTGGLSMEWLIHALGLDQPTLVEKVGRAQLTARAKQEALERVSQMGLAGHFSSRLIGEIEEEYQSSAGEVQQNLAVLQSECDHNDMKQALWMEALTIEKTTYRELLDHGEISEQVLRELELAVELQRDQLKAGQFPIVVPAAVPLELRFTGWVIRMIERAMPKNKLVKRYRLRSLAAQYEHDMASLEASRRAVAEIKGKADLLPDQAAADEVAEVYEDRGKESMERIDAVGESFPEYVKAVQLLAARRVVLDAEAGAVERIAVTGGIPDSVAKDARRQVGRQQRELMRQPVEALEPNPEDLVSQVPFFRELPESEIRDIVAKLIPKTVVSGEVIMQQGERGFSLFLIARGVVSIHKSIEGQPPKRVNSLYAGDIFGETAILTSQPRNATVRAASAAQLYELQKRDVDLLCNTCAGLRNAMQAAMESRQDLE